MILVIDGMGNFVLNQIDIDAFLAKFGMKIINDVYALMAHTGVDITVWLFRNVREVNILIVLYRNVYV